MPATFNDGERLCRSELFWICRRRQRWRRQSQRDVHEIEAMRTPGTRSSMLAAAVELENCDERSDEH